MTAVPSLYAGPGSFSLLKLVLACIAAIQAQCARSDNSRVSHACTAGIALHADCASIESVLSRTRIVLPHKLVLACEAAIRAQQCARSSNPQASHACPAGKRIDFRQAYELAMRVSAPVSSIDVDVTFARLSALLPHCMQIVSTQPSVCISCISSTTRPLKKHSRSSKVAMDAVGLFPFKRLKSCGGPEAFGTPPTFTRCYRGAASELDRPVYPCWKI